MVVSLQGKTNAFTVDRIPFNKPYLSGKELYYISQTIHSGKSSGNNQFTKKCHAWFKEHYEFPKSLLTTSCTDALEMASILINIQPGDEVIMPSYTFVSTANAFILRGAIIRFADCYSNNPNIDPDQIEPLINEKTKAIIVVHYAGIACDMDKILAIANKHSLYVIEDAAQAIDSNYKGKPLGTIGDISAFSYHETKNIICGEGGMLVVNNPDFQSRSEIIWEKGTNRSAFFRGEVDKYGWVDVGSSFLPSEILAAFLYAQLEHLDEIQSKRKAIWNRYNEAFQDLEKSGKIEQLPFVPDYGEQNGHLFYVLCKNPEDRAGLINHLKANNVHAVFHYLSLHKSPFYKDKHDGRELPNTDKFADCLVRLPLYFELSEDQQAHVIDSVINYFN